MKRIERTVFISYRRTNAPWALAIYQSLTGRGYDVFFDFTSVASGDFERVILENIKARAHFVVLLTPSALERCDEPGDWVRREIETALETQRNIVPLMLEGFDFGTPAIARHLTGKLSALKKYNALRIPADYFDEAMVRLCDKYLNVPLSAVLHPLPNATQQAVRTQQAAASAAPRVAHKHLTAQEWAEQAYRSDDSDEQIRCYTEAIRLKPDYAEAYNNRGIARKAHGDPVGAIQDYTRSIELKNPELHLPYNNRGLARHAQGDVAGAIGDYSQAIRLKPDYASAYYDRGIARSAQGDFAGAIGDYDQAIRLKPDFVNAYYNRGGARKAQGDLAGAIQDYQKYLDLGGGVRGGDQAEVEGWIRDLKKKLTARG